MMRKATEIRPRIKNMAQLISAKHRGSKAISMNNSVNKLDNIQET